MAAPRKPVSGAQAGTDDTEKVLKWLEGVPDPQERYRRATEELEHHQMVVERLSSVRASAAADAYESGETVRALAARLGLSPSRPPADPSSQVPLPEGARA